MNDIEKIYTLGTLREAKNALEDYIETIEKRGNATLNYGRSVLKQIDKNIILLED